MKKLKVGDKVWSTDNLRGYIITSETPPQAKAQVLDGGSSDFRFVHEDLLYNGKLFKAWASTYKDAVKSKMARMVFELKVFQKQYFEILREDI